VLAALCFRLTNCFAHRSLITQPHARGLAPQSSLLYPSILKETSYAGHFGHEPKSGLVFKLIGMRLSMSEKDFLRLMSASGDR